ncbi:META domain-containing protein [Marinobacter sp. AN1]|uniref:META domain-containing protein n=1 Tax=Marinobacter sp. AN1 TaxID=2886046 RepID=UPI00222EA1F8|nr:META domain-containing protein [Marinobacter sp. AN1]UZD66138.1 META domain-containing protein [Marinobacter sp. AN1]
MKGMSVAGRIIVLGCLAVLAACASGPGSQQGGPVPTAPLTNTYWKLVELRGNAVNVPQGQQGEPHMIFRDDGRVNGFSGCNRFVGEYTVTGANLLFDSMASTRMACPDDNNESVLYDVFADTAGVFLEGKVLKLLDEQGHGLARFEAVALP